MIVTSVPQILQCSQSSHSECPTRSYVICPHNIQNPLTHLLLLPPSSTWSPCCSWISRDMFLHQGLLCCLDPFLLARMSLLSGDNYDTLFRMRILSNLPHVSSFLSLFFLYSLSPSQ